MAQDIHIRTSLGNHHRQFLHRLGPVHLSNQHSNILLRSALFRHPIGNFVWRFSIMASIVYEIDAV